MNAASNRSPHWARRRLLPWAAGALLLVPMALVHADSASAQERRAMSRSSSSKSSSGSSRSASSSRSSSRSSASQGSKSRSSSSASRSSSARRNSSSGRSAGSTRTATRRNAPLQRSQASGNSSAGRRDVSRTRPTAQHRDYDRVRRDRQRKHHRGHGHSHSYGYGYRHGYGHGYGHSLSFYLGHYGLFGYPYYYGYGRHHYGYGYPRYAYYRSSDDMGAVDLNVRPKKAEVYVNGQRIGNVGEFDGFPGYLWLEEDVYDIVIYRPGYQTYHQTVEVYPGLVIDIDQDLVPGEAINPLDIVPPPVRYDGSDAPVSGTHGAGTAGTVGAPGRLFLSVSPEDASVYLDGRLLGSGLEIADVRDGLMLTAGKHEISVLHPRFGAEEREVEIEPGEELRLDIEMN